MGLADHAELARLTCGPGVRRACSCSSSDAQPDAGAVGRGLWAALDVHRSGRARAAEHQPAQHLEDRGRAAARPGGARAGVAGAGEVRECPLLLWRWLVEMLVCPLIMGGRQGAGGLGPRRCGGGGVELSVAVRDSSMTC